MTQPISHSLVTALREVPDLAALDDDALFQLVGASANLFWRAGSVVFTPGSPADALYVVVSGRVRIMEPDSETELATIGPCDYFGEQAVLLHTAHTRTAAAVEDSELMVIPEAAFHTVLAENPDLAGHFRRKLESRVLERG